MGWEAWPPGLGWGGGLATAALAILKDLTGEHYSRERATSEAREK